MHFNFFNFANGFYLNIRTDAGRRKTMHRLFICKYIPHRQFNTQ